MDEGTVETLRTTAERLHKPQSQVVREAIVEYAERVGKLGEQERLRLLQVFDAVVPAIPPRPAAEVDAEISEVRAARRRGGRAKRDRA